MVNALMKSIQNKMESYIPIIISIIDGCNFARYLELGIYEGRTISRIASSCKSIEVAVGVDTRSITETIFHEEPQHKVVILDKTSTNQFFLNNTRIFDVIFIDANHNYNNVLEDFKNSMKILETDGIVFMHDSYPPNIESTSPGYCSDCYRAYYEILKMTDICECVNLPTWCGLNIVRKVSKNRKLFTIP